MEARSRRKRNGPAKKRIKKNGPSSEANYQYLIAD